MPRNTRVRSTVASGGRLGRVKYPRQKRVVCSNGAPSAASERASQMLPRLVSPRRPFSRSALSAAGAEGHRRLPPVRQREAYHSSSHLALLFRGPVDPSRNCGGSSSQRRNKERVFLFHILYGLSSRGSTAYVHLNEAHMAAG